MAQLTNQYREIYKIAVGMYSAAPGKLYFDSLNGALEAGMSMTDVYRELANSPSFQLQNPAFGAQATNAQFTNAFLDGLLGTEVVVTARQFAFNFVFDRLEAGDTRGAVMQIALDALDSVSALDEYFGAAARRLDNRISVAQDFTESVNGSSPDIQFLQSTIALVTGDPGTMLAAMMAFRTGRSFTLTPGVDSGAAFTGAAHSDSFAAPSNSGRQTLNTSDELDGGGGIDTLRAVISNEDAAPVLKNIENVDLQFTGSGEVNLANGSGVRQVTVERSSTLGVVKGLGAVDILVVRDQDHSVVFDNSEVTELDVILDRLGSTKSLVDVVLGTAVPLKAGRVDFALADAHTHVKLNGSAVTNLALDVSGENTFSLNALSGNTKPITLTITGSGSVDVSGALPGVTAIVGTAARGAFDLTVPDTMVSVATGSGADTVMFTEAIDRAPRVDLGGGDDVLTLSGVTATGAVISGGLGADTLNMTNGAWIDAAASTIYSGFERLEVGGGQGTYVLSRLPQVTEVALTNTAPARDIKIVEAAAGTSMSFNGTFAPFAANVSFELADSTGSDDKLQVRLTGIDSRKGGPFEGGMFVNLTAPGIEILDIQSNIPLPEGSRELYWNHLSPMTADKLHTVTVTGNAHLVLGLDSTTTSVSRIDASQSTGGINYSGWWSQAQSVTFIGSSARDIFAASMHGDLINAGGHGDRVLLWDSDSVDRLVYGAGDSLFTTGLRPRYDTVSNFTGAPSDPALADLIDLKSFGFTAAEKSAIVDRGVLGSISDLRMPYQPGWFVTDGHARALATATDVAVNPARPWVQVSTYVFVDANRNGDFEPATDLFIVLAGTPDVSLNNFVF